MEVQEIHDTSLEQGGAILNWEHLSNSNSVDQFE